MCKSCAEKQAAFAECMRVGRALIAADFRKSGVEAPPETKITGAGVLSFRPGERAMSTEAGLCAAIMSGGIATTVFVPWEAIWAIGTFADGKAQIWRADMPAHVQKTAEAFGFACPSLKSVPQEAGVEGAATSSEASAAPKLRLLQ